MSDSTQDKTNLDMTADPWNVTKKEAAPTNESAHFASESEYASPLAEDGELERKSVLEEAAPVEQTAPQNVSQTITLSAEAEKPSSDIETLYNDLGLASMICGVISLVLGFSPWGILGLVFGFLSKRVKTHSSRGTIGIVCSLISVAFFVILCIILCVVYVGIIMGLVSEWGDKLW